MLDSDKYDAVVLGTGIASSITAAALAKAGKSVLHLDPNEYYGGAQASLTLDEFGTWAEQRGSGSSAAVGPGSTSDDPSSSSSTSTTPYATAQRARFPSASTTPLGELAPDRRRYALSLYPSVMASRGSLVHTLIASDVSKYVGFRLLDSVSLWDDTLAAPKRVPGSKEDVFKDKSVSLPDKRRLMKALLFAAGEFEDDEVLAGHQDQPLLSFLSTAFGLNTRLAQALTYAVAHAGAADEPALAALQRARRYLRSIGRYGPRAFLVAQYGGAGEVAQGFCRACAVFGGTYILGPDAAPLDLQIDTASTAGTDDGTATVSLRIPGHPGRITATHLIAPPDYLPANLRPAVESVRVTRYLVAVTTVRPPVLAPAPSGGTGEGEGDEADVDADADDTAVLVFPPSADGAPLVRALVMGEGTGSCPAGQWVVYLWAEASGTDVDGADAEQAGTDPVLTPFLAKVAPTGVAWSTAYVERAELPVEAAKGGSGPVVVLEPYAGAHLLTEGLDWEASEGERAFKVVVGEGEDVPGFFAKKEGEEEAGGGDDDDE